MQHWKQEPILETLLKEEKLKSKSNLARDRKKSIEGQILAEIAKGKQWRITVKKSTFEILSYTVKEALRKYNRMKKERDMHPSKRIGGDSPYFRPALVRA